MAKKPDDGRYGASNALHNDGYNDGAMRERRGREGTP
jgi:hypothetical protein